MQVYSLTTVWILLYHVASNTPVDFTIEVMIQPHQMAPTNCANEAL